MEIKQFNTKRLPWDNITNLYRGAYCFFMLLLKVKFYASVGKHMQKRRMYKAHSLTCNIDDANDILLQTKPKKTSTKDDE